MSAAGATAATSGAAAAAAIANAIKASGAIVQVRPNDFLTIVSRITEPLIIHAQGGFFSKNYQYLVGYKGLVFFTKAPQPLLLSNEIEVVECEKIWIPQ